MDSTTSKSLGRIRKILEQSLKSKYGIEDPHTVDFFLRVHGLHKENFDFIQAVERVISSRINDVSIDGNSNKNEKTVETIAQECSAPIRKAVGIDYLFRTLEKLYGTEKAECLMGDMLDLSLGLGDSVNILKPYCWALNASVIVTEGRPFGQLHSKPSKRVASYISALCETIHQLSSHLAGAIAIGTFFLDISHIALYKEQVDLRDLKTNKTFRKQLENEMQQFVHSVNHLSRSGLESPFSNISVFDRTKLRALVEDMLWYFPLDDLPIEFPRDFDDDTARKEYALSYIVDYIMEVQEIFLDFFDKGDPLTGRAYRFPVVTINFAKEETKSGDSPDLCDHKFLRSMCRRDIYKYNIFASSGSKVASCCRLINNKEMLDFAAQTNSFGGVGISLGSHRVCTINLMRLVLENKDERSFFENLKTRVHNTALILKAHKVLLGELEKSGLQPFISIGWIAMNRMFSTFGIMGLYEAVVLAQKKYNTGERDFTAEVLKELNDLVREFSTACDIIGNVEQIPGESFAIRFAKADRTIFGEEIVPNRLYANQFVPLWEDVTLWKRMEIDGKYNRMLTGGGIVHAQIGEKVTSKQAEKIIRYAVATGSEHFALNAIYCECEKGHIEISNKDKCSVCGGKIVEHYTRVVGYYVPVSSWEKERREWEFPRRSYVELPVDTKEKVK